MATAKVYRPERNWKGEQTTEGYIGEVAGVIIGGPSMQPLKNFPGTVSTEGMIGVPAAQVSGVVVQQNDRLLIGTTLYAVTSDRMWDDENTLTSTAPSHCWYEVRSNT